MKTSTMVAAAKFHCIAACAAKHGGFFVSAGGGTANVVAGIIARATGDSFENAHDALLVTGGEGWYSALAEAQPFRWDAWHAIAPGRWDAGLIARAAVRATNLKGFEPMKNRIDLKG
jgi:hypothetical protein